jgi:hypothetical protein
MVLGCFGLGLESGKKVLFMAEKLRISSVGLGLWPCEMPRFTESEAEKKVFKALQSFLPEGWYAWHSLKLRTRKEGQFTEADFVIADPERPALLILEVKGGKIELIDGYWHQNGKPLQTPPLDQAFKFLNKLVTRFKEEDLDRPRIGAAVCFPDTYFSRQPTHDDLSGLVIGGQDLPYLDKILPDVMEHAVPNPSPAAGRWLECLHAFWGETWKPALNLGAKIRLEEENRFQLDLEQLQRLDEIEENDRVFLKGSAGSGKTLLAREAALRQAGQGKKVLFLCFTEALGKWLSDTITHPNITSTAVRVFAAQLLRDKARENPGSVPSEYWNAVSLRAAMDGLPPEEECWDCVIVDEGQDFSESDWMLAEECLRKPGRFWVFADEAQAFWDDRTTPASVQEFPKIKLSKPYRCPRHIQNLVDCYAGRCKPDFETLREGVQEKIIKVVPSSEERLTKQIGKEINRLLSEGLKPHEIAVISVRGRGAQENICHMSRIGDHWVVSATDKEADSHIICDTFLRFKGLERPAVIVTDLRLVSALYEKRMHIATSRALNLLRIIGVEEEIRKDPILGKLF